VPLLGLAERSVVGHRKVGLVGGILMWVVFVVKNKKGVAHDTKKTHGSFQWSPFVVRLDLVLGDQSVGVLHVLPFPLSRVALNVLITDDVLL